MKRIFSTAVFVTGACLLIGFGYHIMTDSNIISRDYVDVPMSAVASWPEGVAPSSGMQDLGDGSVRVRRNANGELFNPSLNSVVGRDRTTFFFVTQESGKFAIEGLAGANINPADPDLHLKTSDLGITASEEELFMKTMKAELQVMSAEDAPPEEAAVSAGAMAGARAGAMSGTRVDATAGTISGGGFLKVKN